MTYPLEDLLRIRQLRENEAAKKLAHAMDDLNAAQDRLRQSREELSEYSDWRVNRERELYDDVMNADVKPRDLDDLKQDVQILKEKELAFKKRVEECENSVTEFEQAYQRARTEHLATVRNLEKLTEHKREWAQNDARKSEQIQEREQEDFRSRTPDWEL